MLFMFHRYDLIYIFIYFIAFLGFFLLILLCMTNTHFISKVLLISSVFILSSCAKGASIYNEAVDDLKTRLVNPDTIESHLCGRI